MTGFNLNHAVTQLTSLAANKRAARPIASGESVCIAGAFALSGIGDIPDPSPEWDVADAALRSYADQLQRIGGLDLMAQVYDEAAERHGYRSVMGVSASWNGCHGWLH